LFSSVTSAYEAGNARTRRLRVLATVGVVFFVVCVASEHLLSPALGPARHEISEYVHTRSGAVMTAGFLAWALSLAASAALVWRVLRASVLATLLCLASLAVIVVACFPTQTSAGALPAGAMLSTTGRLHDVGSGLTTLALFLAVTVSTLDSRLSSTFRRRAGVLIAATVASASVLLAIGSSVGGIRQRLLVLAACLWQILLLPAISKPVRPSAPARANRPEHKRRRN
jgi:MFS family permease